MNTRALRTRRNRRRGFTLLELIVVLIIIGVLALIAAVAYNLFVNNARQTAIEEDARAVGKATQLYSLTSEVPYSVTDYSLGVLEDIVDGDLPGAPPVSLDDAVVMNGMYEDSTDPEYVLVNLTRGSHTATIRFHVGDVGGNFEVVDDPYDPPTSGDGGYVPTLPGCEDANLPTSWDGTSVTTAMDEVWDALAADSFARHKTYGSYTIEEINSLVPDLGLTTEQTCWVGTGAPLLTLNVYAGAGKFQLDLQGTYNEATSEYPFGVGSYSYLYTDDIGGPPAVRVDAPWTDDADNESSAAIGLYSYINYALADLNDAGNGGLLDLDVADASEIRAYLESREWAINDVTGPAGGPWHVELGENGGERPGSATFTVRDGKVYASDLGPAAPS